MSLLPMQPGLRAAVDQHMAEADAALEEFVSNVRLYLAQDGADDADVAAVLEVNLRRVTDDRLRLAFICAVLRLARQDRS